MNEGEILARVELVALVQAMLTGEQSFLEGAAQILDIKRSLSGIADDDPDFRAFLVILSETEHLPRKAQWPLWSPTALTALKLEFLQAEEWAISVGEEACKNLIERFSPSPAHRRG